MDRHTRWPEAIPLSDTSSMECASALINNWISRFGVPQDITSDRGSQFTSALWTSISQKLGIKVHRTTAYHPQSNGLLERFHRSLKASLMARLMNNANWLAELPWVLLGLRTSPKEDLGASSAELVYGEPLTLPGEFVASSSSPWSSSDQLLKLNSQVDKLIPSPTSRHGNTRSSTLPALISAKFVFIRHDAHRGPLRPPYDGPYKVISRNDKYFMIKIGNREESVSIDRLKPAFTDPNDENPEVIPPRRGRPKKNPINISALSSASSQIDFCTMSVLGGAV